jgi:hypothetical protein
MNELSESIDNTVVADKHEFTVDEINRLISFNQRLPSRLTVICFMEGRADVGL